MIRELLSDLFKVPATFDVRPVVLAYSQMPLFRKRFGVHPQGPLDGEHHPGTGLPKRLSPDALDTSFNICNDLLGLLLLTAHPANRRNRIQNPLHALVADDQGVQPQLAEGRLGLLVSQEDHDQVGFQCQDGFEVGVEVSAYAGFVRGLGWIAAIPRYANHLIAQPQRKERFRNARRHGDNPLGPAAIGPLITPRPVEEPSGQEAAHEDQQDDRGQKEFRSHGGGGFLLVRQLRLLAVR